MTEYRVLPSVRYSAEPSSRTDYRFSPNLEKNGENQLDREHKTDEEVLETIGEE